MLPPCLPPSLSHQLQIQWLPPWPNRLSCEAHYIRNRENCSTASSSCRVVIPTAYLWRRGHLNCVATRVRSKRYNVESSRPDFCPLIDDVSPLTRHMTMKRSVPMISRPAHESKVDSIRYQLYTG